MATEIMGRSENTKPLSRIAIVGRGATAGLFASRFQVAREIEEVRALGREDSIPVSSDLVIFAIPGPVTPALQSRIDSFHAGMTVVLPQNGVEVVDKDTLSALNVRGISVVRASLLSAVSGDMDYGITYDARKKPKIALSPMDQNKDAAQRAAQAFETAGFRVQQVENYHDMEWTKLLLNTIGSTGAITGLAAQATFDSPRLAYLELKGLKDRIDILKDLGVRIVDLESHLGVILRLAQSVPLQILMNDTIRRAVGSYIEEKRDHLPPAAAGKIRLGRPTEIWQYHLPFAQGGSAVDQAILTVYENHLQDKIDLSNPRVLVQDRINLLYQALL